MTCYSASSVRNSGTYVVFGQVANIELLCQPSEPHTYGAMLHTGKGVEIDAVHFCLNLDKKLVKTLKKKEI